MRGIEAENVRVRIKGGEGEEGLGGGMCVCERERESVDVDDCDGAIGQEFGGGGGAGGHVGSGEEWWGCRKLRWVVGVGKNGGAVENFVGLV